MFIPAVVPFAKWKPLGGARALRILAVCALLIGNLLAATAQAQPSAEQRRTLDDLFEAVARRAPEFGGMFLSNNAKTLQIVLTNTSPTTIAAARAAIVDVFGRGAIPEGGIAAQGGHYGFLQLRKWYTAMEGPILNIRGIRFTDIDEARNRLRIGVENAAVQQEVMRQLAKLGIPGGAVSVEVTPPVTPATHTVQSPVAPRQGGYTLRRLLCNQTGIGLSGGTLGFNAFSLNNSGNVRGFVTNSHNTAALWKVDTNAGFPAAQFYQAPGYYPNELVGQETIDYQGFQGFPCPTGQTCRYSDSAFVTYSSSKASAHAMIARTTALTTSISNPIRTVSHVVSVGDVGAGRYGIAAPPSQPYLVGLPLSKVGSTTGWTQGTIQQTNVTVPYPTAFMTVGCPGGRVDNTPPPAGATFLSQYVVDHPTNDVVDGGDSGSPVFRISSPAKKWVELYGILWARIGYKQFIFSPIGGSPYQPAGIQTDLGPLDYVGQCLPPSLPCQ